MPKLAIYIPKRDMKQIDRWRKKINFSRIFMRALADEISRQSRAAAAPNDKVSSAAEFYGARLAADGAGHTDFGYRLGTQHVLDCQLELDVIRRLIRAEQDEASADEVAECIELAGDAVAQIKRYAKDHGIRSDHDPTWLRSVHRGYLQGVADAWQQVCQAME